MTRYSLKGVTVRKEDIPGPAPHSYFEHVTFVGDFGASTQDWRDNTYDGCDLSAVTRLPPGKRLKYIYSRHTTWPIGPIPHDMPLHVHDMAAAYFKQLAKLFPVDSDEHKLLLSGADFNANYFWSFHNIFYAQKQLHGVSEKYIAELMAKHLPADTPMVTASLEYGTDTTAATPGPASHAHDPKRLRVLFLPERTLDISVAFDPAKKDRWVIARALEAAHPGILFWIASLDPLLISAIDSRKTRKLDDFWWRRTGWK